MVPFHLWVNELDLTVCIIVGQWEDSRSATPSCGSRANQLIFRTSLLLKMKHLSEYITAGNRELCGLEWEGLGSLTAWSPPFIVLGLQGTLGLWYSHWRTMVLADL